MAKLIKKVTTENQLDPMEGEYEIWQTVGGQQYTNHVDVVVKHANGEHKQWHHLKHEDADFICDTEWKCKADLIRALHTCGINDITPSDNIGIEDGEMSHIHHFA